MRTAQRFGLTVVGGLVAVGVIGCGGGGGIGNGGWGSNIPTLASISKSVPPSGGTVVLPQYATVTFPAGSFPAAHNVQLAATNSPDTVLTFNETASIFRPGKKVAYEVRINSGNTAPAKNFQITLNVPDAFISAMPSGSGAEAFAQIWEDGGQEILDQFELLPSSFDQTAKAIRISLSPEAFTNQRRADRTYEAIFTIAPTPGTNVNSSPTILAASANDGSCQGTSLGSPLEHPAELSGNPPRGFNPIPSTNPATGQQKPHWGSDLKAVTGDNVLAAADGKIEKVAVQRKDGKIVGYGQYVVLRHTDGSATLYGHLKIGTPLTQGNVVKKGDIIAQADNSGSSTGPHLHFEYVLNGSIFDSKRKVDPLPCIGSNVTTSIVVGDNGNVADDAFQVFLDGLSIGQTTIGGSNNLAAGNLRPGNHTLRIVAVIAPDDQGTLGVALADGVTFQDGSTTASTVLPQGGEISYVIVVPSQQARIQSRSLRLPMLPRQYNEHSVK